jgi:hypothetical protein
MGENVTVDGVVKEVGEVDVRKMLMFWEDGTNRVLGEKGTNGAITGEIEGGVDMEKMSDMMWVWRQRDD